jgi:thiosulfate/3-mercaptopyruvate sulfurtransferase
MSPRGTWVLYGDNNNWFAAYGFWLFKIHGHENVKLMNGGRQKWLNERDKPFTTDRPTFTRVSYVAKAPNEALRARLSEVMKMSGNPNPNLVDVRSPDEYSGKIIAPPGMTETAQRAGHIPGAANVPGAPPWTQTGGLNLSRSSPRSTCGRPASIRRSL